MSATADEPDERTTPARSLGRHAAVMTAGTAVSRALGVVRSAVLIAAVGVNVGPANAFAVANMLPNVLYMLIAGGVLNAVLVPQVVRAYRNADGQVYVDRLLTLTGLVLLGVTAVLTVGSPLIVRAYVSGGSPEQTALATTFALWCIPQVFFYGVYTLLGQVLNARGSFGPYMWAPVVNNVVAIAGLVAFIVAYGQYEEGSATGTFAAWDAGRVTLLAGTATLGVVAQALVLLVPLRRIGFRYRPRTGWRGVGLASAGRVAGWTFAALAVGQLGIVVVQRVASAAAQASGFAPEVPGNAAYGHAFLIFMLPHSLVTVSLVTALFTRMSNHAAAGDRVAVRDDFSYGLRTTGVFTVLATAVVCVLALPLVRAALPSTAPAEASSLARVVVAMTTGLVALGAWSLVQRVYYAYEDARTLFRIQAPMAGLVAGGALLGALTLPYAWWLVAAGAAIGLQYVVGAAAGMVGVHRRLGGTDPAIWRVHARAVVAALAASAVGWPLSRLFGDLSRAGFPKAVLVCALVGVVMLAVYVWLLRRMHVAELDELVAPVLSRLGRSMGGPRSAGGDGASGGGVLKDVEIGRGTLLAGRYRLHEPEPTDLAGAEAWSAHDQILDRPVRALVLREGHVAEALDAARRAALVSDPRLLRILDVGEDDGIPYTVTEVLEGRDLAQLTANGPLTPDQARAIVGEAAVALEVARRRGVHHLALRPSTVRVTPSGQVVVSGLGLDGELVGHDLGDALSTTRADTVALVSLLYLALTGRWPAPAGMAQGDVPAAPHVGGHPVPPAELAPGVPNDLDTLCAVTLGPNDDGPHSPAELVRELEPWVEVRPHPDRVDTTSSSPQPPEPPEDEPREVARTSVRGALRPTASATRPGTPPPAIPPRAPRAGAAVSAAAGASGAVTEAVPDAAAAGAGAGAVPPVVPPARPSTRPSARPSGPSRPAAQGPGLPWPPAGTARPARPSRPVDDDASPLAVLTRRRFDPTPWVLGAVVLALLVGIVMAWNALTAPLPPIGVAEGATAPDVVASPTEPAAQETEEPPAAEPEPEVVPPVITSGVQLDPEGDGDEHPEAVERAYDGDPETFWFTRTYASPRYGMKSGIGYAVTLAEETLVSAVHLDVNGSGGQVEIRATDPSTPTDGTVLASGAMGPDEVYTFAEPVRASSIVLWFTELPVTPDGKNRVELREISLS